MAIIYFSYLFDDERFLKEMLPLIPELETGNYQPLYGLAKKILDTKPELWDILYDLNLGYSFTEEIEVGLNPNSLLMKVLVQFLERITIPEPDAWRILNRALPLIGWPEDDTKRLLFGRSLCSLLKPYKTSSHKDYYDLSQYGLQERPWCEGYMGWLDYESLSQLYKQLIQSRDAFLQFTKHPDEIFQREFYYVEKFSLEWLSKRLIESYEYKLQELSIAYKAKKAIAMAIA